MKVTEFDYTKQDGSSSHRVVLVTTDVSSHVAGIDITQLHPEDQVAFCIEMQEEYNKYVEACKKIQQKFDLTFSYRKFLPSGMNNVVEELYQ